jgi:hypothetical protein
MNGSWPLGNLSDIGVLFIINFSGWNGTFFMGNVRVSTKTRLGTCAARILLLVV